MIKQGQITAPINAADPYKVLGVAATKGYDIGTICRNSHGKMNKWSVHKPISVANILRPLTDAEIKTADCGLRAFYTTSIAAAVAKVKEGCDWEYNPPTGGMASPYRLSDFNGYDHNTPRWCQLVVDVDTKQMVRFTGMEEGINMIRDWIGSISDLLDPLKSNAYACMLLFRLNAGAVRSPSLYVMGELQGNFDWEKQCNLSHELVEAQIGSGDVYVIPAVALLSQTPLTLPHIISGEVQGAVTVYPLPSERVTVRIKSIAEQKLYPSDIGIRFEYAPNSGHVAWSEKPNYDWKCDYRFNVVLSNSGTNTRTVRLTLNAVSPATGEVEVQKDVPAGGSVTVSITGFVETVTEPKDGYDTDNVRLNYTLTVLNYNGSSISENGDIEITNNQ